MSGWTDALRPPKPEKPSFVRRRRPPPRARRPLNAGERVRHRDDDERWGVVVIPSGASSYFKEKYKLSPRVKVLWMWPVDDVYEWLDEDKLTLGDAVSELGRLGRSL